jgi:hypothetical protein
MGHVVRDYQLYFQDLTRVVFDGGAEDVYILHSSSHAMASGITTGTTVSPLLGFSC